METTQLTVAQVYDEEFKGSLGRGESAFGIVMAKLISQKLGKPQDDEQKKDRFSRHIDEYPRARGYSRSERARISPTSARAVARSEQNIPAIRALGQSRISPCQWCCEYPWHGDIKTYEKTYKNHIPDLGASGRSRISPAPALGQSRISPRTGVFIRT